MIKSLFLFGALGLARASVSSLDAELEATPLTKVVELLKEMKVQNEKEMKEDQEIFDKLACWCHTNREEKTAAVEENTEKIAALEGTIKELSARHAQLGEEISNLKKEIKEDEDSLEAATVEREKQAAAFHKIETDTVQALGQLKGAITILSKHQSSLLQSSTINNIATVMKHISYKFPGVVTSDDLSLVQSRPYANQSSEIFGILQSMQETMTADLTEAQKQEAKDAAQFKAMRDAKMEELAAARTQLENKEAEYADTGLKNAEAKEDLEDTQATLEADQAFLKDLEERCAANEKEMEERTKTRQAEIVAINETIEILVSDEARDTANKTLVFLQTRIATEKVNFIRNRAAGLLKKAALKSGNPELSMLASSVQLDAFTKVKKAIDDMIAQLKIDQKDEVTKKDFCNTEFHSNEMQTTDANRKLDGLKGKEADLEASIDSMKEALKTLAAEIAEMQVELQRASEDRKTESVVFQQAVDDQISMQQILKKAVKRMEKFYNASLVQTTQGPPPGLKEGGYQKNQGSTGVVGMLQEIISDSKQTEAELIKSEQDATTAYESFVSESNNGILTRQKATVATSENKANAEKELVQCKEDISSTITDLEKLAEYNAQLHKSCDFVLKNFEVRQTARSEEIEALQQAKQILSGAQ